MVEMIKGVFEMAKSSPMKLVLILAIISALGGFYVYHIDQVKSSGYNQCLVDMKAANEKAESEELAKLKKKIKELQEQRDTFEKSASDARKIIEDRNIENKVLKNEIANFGKHSVHCVFEPEFQRLFNDIIGEPPAVN